MPLEICDSLINGQPRSRQVSYSTQVVKWRFPRRSRPNNQIANRTWKYNCIINGAEPQSLWCPKHRLKTLAGVRPWLLQRLVEIGHADINAVGHETAGAGSRGGMLSFVYRMWKIRMPWMTQLFGKFSIKKVFCLFFVSELVVKQTSKWRSGFLPVLYLVWKVTIIFIHCILTIWSVYPFFLVWFAFLVIRISTCASLSTEVV